jgi:hypothetical protein
MEFTSPLIDQARGDNEQDRLNSSPNAQDPDCGNRLNGLSEPHIVGEKDLLTSEQRSDSVQLKLHQVRWPIESCRETGQQ